MLTGREPLSSRGRNQFLRMLLEGRTRDVSAAEESFSTCLLCGACSDVCYAKVPTPDLVLEGRRAKDGYGRGLAARLAVDLLLNRRAFFELLLKAGYLLKRLKLAALADKLGLYDFLGMPAVGEAQASVGAPLRFLRDILRKDPALNPRGKDSIAWAYFAPCGPNYAFTEVGLATVSLLKRFLGEGVFIDNSCCGLIAYNYGRIIEAREFAKRNILRFEELKASCGDFAVIGDCSSCVAFMKSYEQLFTDDEEWRPRAKAFSAAVRDILEALPAEKVSGRAPAAGTTVTYHDSCRACHGQGVRAEPRAVLKKLAGEAFVELPESEWCCGGAGAYAFTQTEMSERIGERKIRNIASTGAGTVLVGGTSCLIQIGAGLKAGYPSAKAEHYSVYIDTLTK